MSIFLFARAAPRGAGGRQIDSHGGDELMSDMKKRWTKPQLIILSRGAPEESVLDTCKYCDCPGAFPGGSKEQCCGTYYAAIGVCAQCVMLSSS